MFRIVVATVGACALVAATVHPAAAASDPVAKCSSSKRKAAGKKGGALLSCNSKARGKDTTTVDPGSTVGFLSYAALVG